jgi:ribosomal protein S12 methylthiotransferase
MIFHRRSAGTRRRNHGNTAVDFGIAYATKVGQTINVLIDREEDEYYVGRTEWDSPEVDGEVLIPVSAQLEIGQFYKVKINSAFMFDLYGDVI